MVIKRFLGGFLSSLNGIIQSGRKAPEKLPFITTGLSQYGHNAADVSAPHIISPPQDSQV